MLLISVKLLSSWWGETAPQGDAALLSWGGWGGPCDTQQHQPQWGHHQVVLKPSEVTTNISRLIFSHYFRTHYVFSVVLWQFPINPCDYTALGLHSAVSFLKLVDWLCWLGYWSEGWWITLIQIVSYFSCSDIVDYFTYPLANKSGYMIPTFWLFCFEFEIRTMLLYLW